MVFVKSHVTASSLVRLPVLGLAAAIMAAAACTDTSDTPESDQDSTAPSTSPTLAPEAIDDPEQAAIAAYTRYWDTAMASLAAPDGDFAELEAIASGQALEQAKAIEQRGIDEGVHVQGDLVHNLEVKDTLLEGDTQQVILIDCADSTATQILDADGKPVADEEYGYREVQSRVELLDGYWIVTAMAVQEIGSCVPDDS